MILNDAMATGSVERKELKAQFNARFNVNAKYNEGYVGVTAAGDVIALTTSEGTARSGKRYASVMLDADNVKLLIKNLKAALSEVEAA